MGSNDPHIEMHRWYCIVYFGEIVLAVIANTSDGLVRFDSLEEYEAAEARGW